MDYYKFQVTNDPADTEVLVALFSTEPFDTFLENDGGFEAYLPADVYDEKIEATLARLQARFAFSFEKTLIKSENWNEAWESNFHPVIIGDFCGIRADFHQPLENVRHELVINPKMAFGTGHHETTHAVIQLMENIDFSGQQVLDYGCGTGVLAILAARLEASEIDAVDIEAESFQNTLENCRKNGVGQVSAFHGTLKDVPLKSYGIVLANINRNVILDSLKPLAGVVLQKGLLVISGFVSADRELMEDALSRHGFNPERTIEKNNWLAMQCRRV